MTRALDLAGVKFGSLTAIDSVSKQCGNRKNVYWRCKCECGKEKLIRASSLTGGVTKSCGCKKNVRTHGEATRKGRTRLYHVWKGMLARCRRVTHKNYKDYGGRGICVCPEWLDYSTFRVWAFANGYDDLAKRGECTLDRVNNDGNYEPSNCRWVNMKIQASNRRPRRKGDN